MALHVTHQVHFDVEDRSVLVPLIDSDGTVHLPIIKEGSTVGPFRFTPKDPLDVAVTVTAHTYKAEWRYGDRGADGAVAFTGVFTIIDANTVECRVESASMEGMESELSGHWDCEVEFVDGGPANQKERVMEGLWIGTKESTQV